MKYSRMIKSYGNSETFYNNIITALQQRTNFKMRIIIYTDAFAVVRYFVKPNTERDVLYET